VVSSLVGHASCSGPRHRRAPGGELGGRCSTAKMTTDAGDEPSQLEPNADPGGAGESSGEAFKGHLFGRFAQRP
jgi:hypothetical protein